MVEVTSTILDLCFSLYGVVPVPNITNVIVDRSIEATTDSTPINYVRLKIDPKSAAVFTWEQVNVP